jgi:Heavy-metal resistance
MTDVNPNKPRRSWLPQLRSRWWTVLLGLSLMLNLLIGGIVAGARFGGGPEGRMMGASYVQLIPRKFFRDISGERRDALMQIVKDNRDELRNLRDASEGASLKLADVLDKENFSIDELRQTVTAFSTGTESLAARGGEVVVKIVSQLTPEERKLLAAAIRDRDAKSNRRKKS